MVAMFVGYDHMADILRLYAGFLHLRQDAVASPASTRMVSPLLSIAKQGL
jgi:hypothetical protein